MIYQKIQNSIDVELTEDLTAAANLTIFIKQGENEFRYPATKVSNKEVVAVMPKTDADKLLEGTCLIQLCWTDEDGFPWATDAEEEEVGKVISKNGFGD